MDLRWLFLGLMLPFLPLWGGSPTVPGSARADAPRPVPTPVVSAEPVVQEAVDLLLAPATTRVDVFVVIYGGRLVPVRPETIDKQYDYRITIPGPFPSPLQRSLAFALQTAAIQRDDTVEPLYPMWGLVFRDFRGERVLTMYFDDYVTKGLINGTPVKLDEKVGRVLQYRCAPLWR
jgi:hypothetical protein